MPLQDMQVKLAGWVSYCFYCSLQPIFGNKIN